jgi:hypothetical protein
VVDPAGVVAAEVIDLLPMVLLPAAVVVPEVTGVAVEAVVVAAEVAEEATAAEVACKPKNTMLPSRCVLTI